MKTIQFKTFPVSGGSYTSARSLETPKTHLCEVDAAGFPVSVHCRRVRFSSILEDASMGEDVPPTCSSCLKAWNALKGV